MTKAKDQQPGTAVSQAAESDPLGDVFAEQDEAARERFLARGTRRAPAPRYRIQTGKSGRTLEAADGNELRAMTRLADTLATGDGSLAHGLLHQIASVATDEHELNLMVSAVHGIAPRDETEALLAVQMAMVHGLTMRQGKRLAAAGSIDQLEASGNTLTRLTRTFAAQVDTLKRYRTTGEQRVTVQHQHVTVSADQAIVGISQKGGGRDEIASQCLEPHSPAQSCAAVLGYVEADRLALPGTSGPRQASVQVPRREGRRTKRSG